MVSKYQHDGEKIKTNNMKVEIDDKALQIISSALEIYTRMQTGQFKIALEEAFPKKCWDVDYEDLNRLEHEIQKLVIPDLVDSPPKERDCGDIDDDGCATYKKEPVTFPRNKYYGIFQTDEDNQTAWSIKKAIDEYLSVKSNDGYYDMGVNFQGPIYPCESFRLLDESWSYKEFHIFEDQDKIRSMMERVTGADSQLGWTKVWDYVDEIYPKEDRPFFSCDSMSILPTGEDCLGQIIFGLRVHKPRLK